MRFNRIFERNIEDLLELLTNKDAVKDAKSYLEQCRKARDEANAAVDKANKRADELDAREVEIAGLDAKFDEARAEIAKLDAGIDAATVKLEAREAGLRAREDKLDEEALALKRKEEALAVREAQAKDALERAERLSRDADSLNASVEAARSEQVAREAELKRFLGG